VAITRRTPGGWLDGSAWLFVLLALLTVLPAACVLWFMNEALTRESAASHQRVLEAYRGQLRLVRSRLDPIWRAQAASLNAKAGSPEQRFNRLITSERAEGAILLTPDGAVEYPDRSVQQDRETETIEQQLATAAAAKGEARRPTVDAIAARLNDYSRPMAEAARLAFMTRLRQLSPNVLLPTEAALRLSFDMLDAERPSPISDVLRQTAVPDVWALTSEDRRVIAFYRIGRVEEMMHDFLHQVAPSGIIFLAVPPDMRADSEAIAAGSWLPGWQLSFMPIESSEFDAEDRQHRLLYVSVALAGIALIAIVGVAAAGSLRRHLRLARLKTDLVAAASHELRSPLASMRVLVDGLLADESFDPKKTREYLEMLAVENARLSRLIENFLTFSLLERNRHRFAFAPSEPGAIVAAAVETVRDRLPADGDLRVEVPASLPPVMADADALQTALSNLLENAIKYTPVHKRIVVRVSQDGDGAVLFAVEDNGIGIPVREQRRIFRRFYRVDQRLSRDTSGVGLGLSIVELIVRGHHGSVTVHSAPGAGSTFTMRVPCAGPERSRGVQEGTAA
jgi:two-component system, OmpR family, phosphate regulon sensor histidine kinase PhoR